MVDTVHDDTVTARQLCESWGGEGGGLCVGSEQGQ